VDRAFRLGQKRDVLVYRLVTIGTIEQRVVQVQERKKALAESVFGGVEHEIDLFDLSENAWPSADKMSLVVDTVRNKLGLRPGADEIISQVEALRFGEEHERGPLAKLVDNGLVVGVQEYQAHVEDQTQVVGASENYMAEDDEKAVRDVVSAAKGWLKRVKGELE